jgi:PAS domain S-box-containing protein
MVLALFAERATTSIAVIATAILADLLLDRWHTPGLSLASPPFNEKMQAQLFVVSCSLASQLIINAIRRRRNAEASLDRALQDYRMLAENVSDVIIRYDQASVIQYVSPSVEQFGYQPSDLVGRNMAEFGHPEDEVRTAVTREDVTRGRAMAPSEKHEFRARLADGSWAWMQGRPAPLYDERGDPVGAVTVIRDITARVALEDELLRKRAEAEAAAVAKSEFLSNMSHEIRTPLTGMLGFAGLLASIENLPESAQTYANRIATSGQALLTVVNDILDFSKLDAGQIELDPHSFDPAALVAESLDLVGLEAARKGLALDLVVEGELPATVLADSSRVRQVLLNLLTNAIKFTDKGGITVTARYLPGEAQLRFAVADTGVGIPVDRRDRLFQRFSQVDGSINREYGGTGLGLAISKGLVEKMGGVIDVESQQGAGSTFWFTVDAPLADSNGVTEPEAAGQIRLGDARILVVDDVAMNRELVRIMLSPFGYDLVEAASGVDALAAALADKFDLILMDLQMPAMDGLGATRAIRQTSELNRTTPILALSANVLPIHLAECAQAGMDDHIAKPIAAADLLTKIARWTAPNQLSDVAETATA